MRHFVCAMCVVGLVGFPTGVNAQALSATHSVSVGLSFRF